jgi:hypothetical protein
MDLLQYIPYTNDEMNAVIHYFQQHIYEDLLHRTLIHMNTTDVIKICACNNTIDDLCNTRFWKQKYYYYKYDYLSIYTKNISLLKWRRIFNNIELAIHNAQNIIYAVNHYYFTYQYALKENTSHIILLEIPHILSKHIYIPQDTLLKTVIYILYHHYNGKVFNTEKIYSFYKSLLCHVINKYNILKID